jgi:Delta24(24(1))-sterol reductase
MSPVKREAPAASSMDETEAYESTLGSNGHALNGSTLNGHASNGPALNGHRATNDALKVGEELHRASVSPAPATSFDLKPTATVQSQIAKKSGDEHEHFEFGGAPGVTAMMIGFPLLMWYMWIGQEYYAGKFPTPEKGQSFAEFGVHMFNLVKEVILPFTLFDIRHETCFRI